MGKKSAGIMLYKWEKNVLKILLAHPGGPFWAKKDAGVWSIPKGEYDEAEDALTAAKREFEEELGIKIQASAFLELPPVKSKSNKAVTAFAVEGDIDAAAIVSNLIWINWPPRSNQRIQVAEIDKAEWFTLETAREKILAYQLPLLGFLEEVLKEKGL